MGHRSKNDVALTRAVITVAAIALLAGHLVWPSLSIDYITTVLVVIALMPWLPAIIQSAKFPGGWEVTFRQIEDKVENQQAELETQRRILDQQQEIINQLVVFSMAFFLFERLKGLHYARRNHTEYIFQKTDDFIKDLRYLRDHGYIEILGIAQLNDGQDIAQIVKLTPIGEFYVQLREKYESHTGPLNPTGASCNNRLQPSGGSGRS
ncbi:MAG: hypothetical protein WEB58_14930 [Planctomycetaceae bacterium]